MNKSKERDQTKKGLRKFLKSSRKSKKEKKRIASYYRLLTFLKIYGDKNNIPFTPPSYKRVKHVASLGKKPNYDDTINYLIPKYNQFSPIELPIIESGILEVPKVFSLCENHDESMFFIKRLFNVLYKQNTKNIIIDYKKCTYLDVDASAFMDVILAGFIQYYKKCIIKGHVVKTDKILPINIVSNEVLNVLFSIGCYKNIKGFELKPNKQLDFIPFSLRIGDSEIDKKGKFKEIHETEIVDYVIACLKETNKTLTPDAESHLSKVVGEVMANAEEHSNFRYRFAIGYFLKPKEQNNHLGTFKLSIFNFGQTIYESFNKPQCQDYDVVKRMKVLSSDFTKNGIFKKAEFEEQTLWTLYALQEGVTSTKDWKRGKGTIRFIDRFFRLKGDEVKDNVSKLTLISGNTQIIFDGTYPLKEVNKGIENKKYQMMTFNDTGKITEKPNENYVKFAPQYFPGTLISAKICITLRNIESN